ncbi:hypothetical protein PVAP13_5KG678607 [Panicum virgatum]|uniref:KIB1-4 beta-propeller domain-containing protein n=1 Tax=Panicum virgatum TaxID=38727 RepID=A0A8T0SYL0_PANVG|nr:hypothetical protein PVAP13_5KG678607 [Panicum virgatum]
METTSTVAGASVQGGGGRLPLVSTPLLVYDHGTFPNNRQAAFRIADRRLFTHALPELTENSFHVTPHGWVLLHDSRSLRTRLWDPRSGRSLAMSAQSRRFQHALPDTEHALPASWRCYLSDAPSAASCVVLLLYMAEPKLLYCRVGDARWAAHEYAIGDVALPPEYAPLEKRVIQQAAAACGKFYFAEAGNLGILEFSPAPEFSHHDYAHAEFPDESNYSRAYVVASGGELFDVQVYLKGFTPEILTVRVHRFDLSGADSDSTRVPIGDSSVALREIADVRSQT